MCWYEIGKVIVLINFLLGYGVVVKVVYGVIVWLKYWGVDVVEIVGGDVYDVCYLFVVVVVKGIDVVMVIGGDGVVFNVL